MKTLKSLGVGLGVMLAAFASSSTPVLQNNSLQMRLPLGLPASSQTARLRKDPRNNTPLFSQVNGGIYQLTINAGVNASTVRLSVAGLGNGCNCYEPSK